jgi:hypothetical protein
VDPDGEFFLTALLGFTLEALLFDTAMFAIAGGISEISEGGTFVKGFFEGLALGAVSSLTAGIATELTSISSIAGLGNAAALPIGSNAAKLSGLLYSSNQLCLLGRHGIDQNTWDGIFPLFGHHGAWGQFGVSFMSLLPLPGIFPGHVFYSIGWIAAGAASFDDFWQHSIVQHFNPDYLSPLHILWDKFTD